MTLARPPAAYDTIFLADIHGMNTTLGRCLRALGVVDEAGHWAYGAGCLVQLGDVMDRGPDSMGVVRNLRRWQAEAADAGGSLIILLGNHDLFALQAGLGDPDGRFNWQLNGCAATYRSWAAEHGARNGFGPQPPPQPGTLGDEDWQPAWPYPEEFYAEFGPDGQIGRWLRTACIAKRVRKVLAVHAGVVGRKPSEVNRELHRVLTNNALLARRLADPEDRLFGGDGPMWVRDLPREQVAEACAALGLTAQIVGHTIVEGIRVRGRLVQTDAGMVRFDRWAALGMNRKGLWALREGWDPERIEPGRDQFLPILREEEQRARTQESQEDEVEHALPPRYEQGDIAWLFGTADGRYARYFLVIRPIVYRGQHGYVGIDLVVRETQVEAGPASWPAEFVDHMGRPAQEGPLSVEQLQRAFMAAL